MTHKNLESRMTLIVKGKVQGVFFRASTLEQAQLLNITGWVQNLADGAVEVVAEGPRYALEELLSWARVGPPSAQVSDVQVRWEPCLQAFQTFQIKS